MNKYKKIHQSKYKNRKKINLKRNAAILIMVCIIAIISFSRKTKTEISLILNNEEITQKLVNQIVNIDDIVYLSFEDIEKYIDKTVYLENEKSIITTSKKKVACLEMESNVISINGSEKDILAMPLKINEKIFLPISELESVYDIDFTYDKTSKIAVIDDLSTKKTVATAKKKIKVKEKNKFFSKTITKVKKDDTLVCTEEDGKWTKIITTSGYIGYTKTKNLKDIHIERESLELNRVESINENEDYLEKDITDENIQSFYERNKLIQNIFIEAINNDKMQVKLICKDTNKNIERLKIEAIPIFNECGIVCEFK